MVAPDHTAERLLGIIQDFITELQPGRREALPAAIDSSLEKDLSLDSLSRVELFSRIEQAMDVTLPQHVFAAAETPRDLLRAIDRAGDARRMVLPLEVKPLSPGEAEAVPERAGTLVDVLNWHVQVHPNRPHIYLYEEDAIDAQITYAELQQGAGSVASGLIETGLQPGRTAAIMLPTSADYFYSFFGILMAGGIPVPLYPPARLTQIEDHLRRHAGILNNARTTILVTVPEAQALARLLRAQVESLQHVVTVRELSGGSRDHPLPVPQPGDIAFLQYTSGSTGSPKGVVLTHTNLLTNIRTMGRAFRVDSTDIFISWLPLYHDMGLIGAWLSSLHYAMPLALMSPLAFLTRPSRWLLAIDRHRGTLSAGPNFAYDYCLNKIDDREIENLDLSSWRLAINGAEPVSPITVRRFQKRFGKYGFQPGALIPSYGLAEASLGLAFPPLGQPPAIDTIRREPFVCNRRALPADAADPSTLQFVSCGHPLADHEIRIVDASGRELGEREEGRLQFKGPSTTSGYYRNAEQTRRLFDGDWLDSGDLAYIADGEVYPTGRSKDLIIRAGRNIYPVELEEAIGSLPGIRTGCVAIFGSTDPVSGTEQLVILAETRETEAGKREELRKEITATAVDLIGTPPDRVVLAPPHTVLKTSSGKIRRAASRELYESGRVGKKQRAVWWQVMRLAWQGVVPLARHSRRRGVAFLYAGWLWALVAALAPVTWLAVILTPGFIRRYRIMRSSAKLLLRLSGIPFSIRGIDNLHPEAHFILVANHASYVDSFILAASLPGSFSYVAKGELAEQFFTRIFLRRIRTEFVERMDMQKGLIDAGRVAGAVRQGRSLIFFPEGTIYRMPGLHAFHMGAFVAAARAGVPVVPVVIRGTRSLLRADTWFPRRAAVSVRILPPIPPAGSDWNAAVNLRRATREAIIKYCGEPDMG